MLLLLFLSVVTHVCLLVIKALSLIFAVLTTAVAGVLGSTGLPKMIRKVLVRPGLDPFGVKVAGMSRVTASTSVATMLQEQGASAVPLRVRMENVSQILVTDNVSSGTQAILPTPAVKMDPTTALQLKEVAQETRYPIFGILELLLLN